MNVRICDVGPRDGLQNEPVTLSCSTRARLCADLAAAGVPSVEAVSFVRDDRVPQLARAEEVAAALPARSATIWSALVLNARGLERARAAGFREVHIAVMATDAFARANVGAGRDEAIEACVAIVEDAKRVGLRVAATVSVAFGCPFEGRVDPGFVASIAEKLAAAGAHELMLADTIGCALPHQVRDGVDRLLAHRVPVGIHVHDTRGTGSVNVLAALERGATVIETSVGGIGGCPFAPRATGNVATEDVVFLLEGEGVATGIDLERLILVARQLEADLGHTLPGRLMKAGTFPPGT